MNKYEIQEDELRNFVKKVYEEGCHGYLDLKDSMCELMVNVFLKDRKPVEPYYKLSESGGSLITVNSNNMVPLRMDDVVSEGIQIRTSSGHDILLRDDIEIRDDFL